MAPEIFRKNDVHPTVSSGIHSVETGIAKASESNASVVIEQAIQSFSWTEIHDTTSGTSDWSSNLQESNVAVEGFLDSPAAYFRSSHKSGSDPISILNGDISAKEVATKLVSTAHFDPGIAAFLRSGIPEALASLKIKTNSGLAPTPFPPSLDELLTPEKLKNPNQRKLQESIRAVNEMFTTLRKIQTATNDMKLNMLRVVRA